VTRRAVYDSGTIQLGATPKAVEARTARPPRSVAPPEARGPMPVVVGVPRSGTTLLAVMLDSHPAVAIPPETAFLPELRRLAGLEGDALRQRYFELVTTDRWGVSNWNDLGLDREAYGRRLDELATFTLTAALRVLFGMLADAAGKPRYGEKTPADINHMPLIESLLPEARFVHIVRDPRDVVLSLRKTTAGSTVETSAGHWAAMIGSVRAAAVRHLHTLRYEDLLDAPEPRLREVCAFLDLDFDARMLDHRQSGARHVAHLGDRPTPDGRAIVPRALRARIHENLAGPIRRDRAGTWQREMGAQDRATVERVCGALMREYGYL
jgi:hypothetical protein